jgi:hypothetical protein
LAASKTFIVDEIADCPKLHFSLGKLWTVRKQTYAICEICGGAFCNEHILIDERMVCIHKPEIRN